MDNINTFRDDSPALPSLAVSQVHAHADAPVQGVSQRAFNTQHCKKVVLSKNSSPYLSVGHDFSDITNRTKESKLSKASW